MTIQPTTINHLRHALEKSGDKAAPGPASEELLRQELLAKDEAAALGRVEPVVETMFLMMGVDGMVAREELDLIWDVVRELTKSELRAETIKGLVKFFGARLKEQGWKTRLGEVAGSLSGDREVAEGAFALAAAVALADEDIAQQENTLVDQLAERLGIDDTRCCEILDRVKSER